MLTRMDRARAAAEALAADFKKNGLPVPEGGMAWFQSGWIYGYGAREGDEMANTEARMAKRREDKIAELGFTENESDLGAAQAAESRSEP